jgi:hypothetical protein
MPYVFVLDGGNFKVKAITGASRHSFLSTIAEVMPHDYTDAPHRYGANQFQDYLKIGDKHYVVGETAQNFPIMRRSGAPKYTRDYYGVLFASAISRLAPSLGERDKKGLYKDLKKHGVYVIASHASRDYGYHEILKDSLMGRWEFEAGGQPFDFKVVDVDTYEEPFGGYACQAFVKGDNGIWSTPIHHLNVGVIDIGGGTCGTLAIRAGGEVDYTAAGSAAQGMNDVIERLRKALKAYDPKFFGSGKEIPLRQLQDTVRTGVYKGKGKEMPVKELVQSALNPLLNEVATMWTNELNGGLGIDLLILTGGGNIPLGAEVKKIVDFGEENVVYATGDSTDMLDYANVQGARRFYDLLQVMKSHDRA